MERIIKHRTTVTKTTTSVESPKTMAAAAAERDRLQLKPLENSNLYQRRAHSKENLLVDNNDIDTPSHHQQRYSANYDELPPTLNGFGMTTSSSETWSKNINNNNNNNNLSGSITSNSISVDDEVVFRNVRKNSADLLRLVCQMRSPHASH